MVEHDLPGLGQIQLPPAAFEQRVAQALLQFADLHRKRRLGEVETLGSTGEVPLVRDRPEVAQMVVVQGGHIIR